MPTRAHASLYDGLGMPSPPGHDDRIRRETDYPDARQTPAPEWGRAVRYPGFAPGPRRSWAGYAG